MPQRSLYENLVLDSGELPIHFSIDRYESETEITIPHWHEHLEVHYIVSGCADFYLEQRRIQVAAGDLLIVNCNELHTAISVQHPYEGHVIIFDIPEISPELAKKNYIFINHAKADDEVKCLFERAFQEIALQETGYRALCRGLVTHLLVALCRNYVKESLPEREQASRKKNLQRLNSVLYYLENHSELPLTVQNLAEIACLSEDRFGHLFRECVGMPPLRYLNGLRLRKARKLLQANEHSVTEVARIVGFQDYNHFGRLFRKHYGCTPNEVRLGKAMPMEPIEEI